ncbi:NHL repeat-containing protein [uncultured Roseibium sp.]|uniref:NHL repeat-containing protein n=1 Tax=uncultured Roseibium sp. TaxID=1936171 RepID=UPI0032175434
MRLSTCLVFLLLGLGLAQAAMVGDKPRPFAAFDMAGPSNLNDPFDLAFGPDGRLYVADKRGNRIAVLDPETLNLVESVASGQVPDVHDISFSSNGAAAVAATGLGAVLIFDRLEGERPQALDFLPASSTEGVLSHSNGRIYATTGTTGHLVAFQDGEEIGSVGGLFGTHDVAEAPDGNIWVACTRRRRLVKFSPDLKELQVLDQPKFGFLAPRYLDIDAQGRLVVADSDAQRVLLIDPDGPDGGTLLGVLGDGTPGAGANKFANPEGVAIRGNDYYISDSGNNRIVRYTVVTN